MDASRLPARVHDHAARRFPLGFRIARMPWLRLLASYMLPRGLIESSLRQLYGDPAKVTPELVDLYSDMARRAGQPRRAGAAHRPGPHRPT